MSSSTKGKGKKQGAGGGSSAGPSRGAWSGPSPVSPTYTLKERCDQAHKELGHGLLQGTVKRVSYHEDRYPPYLRKYYGYVECRQLDRFNLDPYSKKDMYFEVRRSVYYASTSSRS